MRNIMSSATKQDLPRYFTALLLFLLKVVEVHAQKYPLPASDSFVISPGQSSNILFDMRWTGFLEQKSDTTWVLHGNSERSAKSFGLRLKTTSHIAPLKFEDCVYFSPTTQACVNVDVNKNSTPHFFISRSDHSRTNYTVPNSVRFYLDTSTIETSLNNMLATDTFPQSLAAVYLRPFYFRKYEVTNAEYREFINWVTDSIARTRLGFFLPDGKLDWKRKYDFYKEASNHDLFIPEGERFYNRKDVDARKLIYRFVNAPAAYGRDTLNIYPDTLSWTDDFTLSFNEHMQNLYNWHPAYDNYPVVGVNYWQCLAFLEWKTMKLQRELDAKGIKCKVECELPSEIEWDYVSTAEKENKNVVLIGRYYAGTCDASWLTDLKLFRNHKGDQKVFYDKDFPRPDTAKRDYFLYSEVLIKKPQPIFVYADDFDKPIRRFDLDDGKTWGDFIYDGYFHTGPAKINPDGFSGKHGNFSNSKKFNEPNERTRAHFDAATGICWLDGNVSEWLREDLDENWRGIFSKHMLFIDGPYAEEEKIIRNYEKYYYDQLPAHGKLVRGCNWFDERFAMKYGKNVGGTQAKTFCDPKEAHCTLGFRYVIYLR